MIPWNSLRGRNPGILCKYNYQLRCQGKTSVEIFGFSYKGWSLRSFCECFSLKLYGITFIAYLAKFVFIWIYFIFAVFLYWVSIFNFLKIIFEKNIIYRFTSIFWEIYAVKVCPKSQKYRFFVFWLYYFIIFFFKKSTIGLSTYTFNFKLYLKKIFKKNVSTYFKLF